MSSHKHSRVGKQNGVVIFIVALVIITATGLLVGSLRHASLSRSNKSAATTTQHPDSKATATDTAPASPQITKVPTNREAKYHVPILMYHYIRIVTDPKDKLGFNLSVTPADFDKQLQWLKDNGYTTFPLADFCKGDMPTEGKPIVLTFDDGYDDAYTDALPALQKYSFQGTFFIIKGFLNRPHYLTTTQLETLGAAGMELGAHTVDHIDLATATPAKQLAEISGSKQASPVLAYPSGQYSPTTIDITKKQGFLCAVTTHPGIATELSPLYELPRVRISGGENIETFSKLVQGLK